MSDLPKPEEMTTSRLILIISGRVFEKGQPLEFTGRVNELCEELDRRLPIGFYPHG